MSFIRIVNTVIDTITSQVSVDTLAIVTFKSKAHKWILAQTTQYNAQANTEESSKSKFQLVFTKK